MSRLPKWMKNKWALFGVSLLATALLCFLIFLIFLKGPFANLFASQGASALEAGDAGKAINRYSLALNLKKNREEIYLGYADALCAVKDYDGAIDLLEQGIDRIAGAEELYLRKVKVYVAAGRIGAAVDFLDDIDNSYINKKIQAARPNDLAYSPTQGKYGTSQKVTLTVRKGETVYYTVNGEDPTLSSSVYSEPITVSSNTTIIAIAVNDEGLVSPRLTLTYEIDNANEPIEFEDYKIEQMVRTALGRPSGQLYAAQLAGVTTLTSEIGESEIRTLKDLEYLPALNALYINDELLIEDYSILARLPGLTSLGISGCALTDENLAQINACHQLTSLDISNNQITSLDPINELSYLEYLNVSGNHLSAIAAVDFPALVSLDLSHNWLSDLTGVENYQALISLNISDNAVTDLTPVAKLKNLNELWMSNTAPTNVKKLSALKNLVMLDVSGCGLASLSVVNDFPALSCLVANYNDVASLSTFKKQVETLSINYNPLVDLSPLTNQKDLTSLEAIGTQIKDVSCLTGLQHLEVLDISDTPVADATVLKDCPALTSLYCSENTSTAGLPDRIYVVVY